ncbi:MAG: bifunctional metallophosphatase/5'-nucleotidase [Ruminococcaceae bacterium]|nr:bifunctional metallophosphatase/5'-nucleotidase [Oscillospiraceae bacterium]
MKKQLILLLLSFIFMLKGCQASPPSGGEETEEITVIQAETAESGDTSSETQVAGETDDTKDSCDANAHKDEENNGYCDLCGEYVVVVVDFYSLNDLHGKFADGDTHIGVDEMTTYLKAARESDEVAILLSAGDMWQGSAESNNTNGNIITDWMNALDFDAMVLGNHEYDWGEDAIVKNNEIAEFPFLAINIYERGDNTLVDYCQPSLLIDKGNIQVGIIGAMGDCYSSIAGDKTEDIYFITGGQLTSLVKAESDRLKAAGADVIVYVIHDGYGKSNYGSVSDVSASALSSYYDASLSNGYVDLVFEGHTHQRYVLRDTYGVYHLQSGGENKGLVHAELKVNVANGECSVNTAEFVASDRYGNEADDPIIQDLLDKYKDEISNALRVVGYNASFKNSTVLRNLVADLYYEAGVERWGDTYPIVLGGGFISVRNPYELPAGEVTYATLQSIFPFDNDLVLCSIKGKDLLSRFINTSNSNYFVSYGREYESDVISRINPNGTYYIVTDTYCSSYAPNRLTVVDTYTPGIYARDLLADYIAEGGMQS